MRRYILTQLFLFTSIFAFGQIKTIDSLKRLLSIAKEDTNKVWLLVNLGLRFYAYDKSDTGIIYGLEALHLSQKLNFVEGEISATGVLSESFGTKGNFSKALEIDFKALQLAEKYNKKELINDCLVLIGNVYFYSGDFPKALTYYLKVLANPNSDEQIASIFGNTQIFGFIGEAYFHLNQLDSASLYINKAYILVNKRGDSWAIPYYYRAMIDAKRGKYKEALDNYRKGIFFSANLLSVMAQGYNGIAEVYKETNQIDSAIYYAREAVALSQKTSSITTLIDPASLLSELYTGKNTDSAFKYQRIMQAAKDSLFNQEKVRQTQNIAFNEQLNRQEQAQQQQELQNKIKLYSLLAALVVFLIIGLLLYRNNRQKQKAYALLEKQKQEIDKQKEKVEQTLKDLRTTQAQLIQSEKMASLGELTAGIAHEIQNPLNFVNNFSEVNQELIDELKGELRAGKTEEAISIADDIKENEQKINHHGKRADAIVKGMLQHSRISTVQKEPTDINALADEYLRLSYHGLRAKDKTFNATLQTDFDESIGNINIIPQDIGRVLLNLYNNAFYAVTEKTKNPQLLKGQQDYEPTVSVSTKTFKPPSGGLGVSISVKDNGNGIPQKVLDKIFQPFFTTKPTGQGTGLGLSLAYDIIKAHGGEIKVETKEEEGSEFIIQISITG